MWSKLWKNIYNYLKIFHCIWFIYNLGTNEFRYIFGKRFYLASHQNYIWRRLYKLKLFEFLLECIRSIKRNFLYIHWYRQRQISVAFSFIIYGFQGISLNSLDVAALIHVFDYVTENVKEQISTISSLFENCSNNLTVFIYRSLSFNLHGYSRILMKHLFALLA